VSGSRGAGQLKRLEDCGFDRDDAILVLQCTFDDEKCVAHDDGVIFFEELRRDDDVGDAVSSSRLRKTNPLAVPGR
jgi:hypothetical protein